MSDKYHSESHQYLALNVITVKNKNEATLINI